MRVYIDTNVIIDLTANREPFVNDAKKIFIKIINKKIVGYISSSALTDIYYILKKMYHNEKMARKKMIDLLQFVEILNTLSISTKVAFDSVLTDYEDGLIEEIAFENKLDYIITRNVKDFANSRVQVCSPKEFLKSIN